MSTNQQTCRNVASTCLPCSIKIKRDEGVDESVSTVVLVAQESTAWYGVGSYALQSTVLKNKNNVEGTQQAVHMLNPVGQLRNVGTGAENDRHL